jgi:hypothetical protein
MQSPILPSMIQPSSSYNGNVCIDICVSINFKLIIKLNAIVIISNTALTKFWQIISNCGTKNDILSLLLSTFQAKQVSLHCNVIKNCSGLNLSEQNSGSIG